MKKVACLIIFLLSIGVINAQISLYSGTTGTTTTVGQSFNEARGVEVKVISASNLDVTAMRLGGFWSGNNGTSTAYVDARIYNSATQALIAWNNDTVSNIIDGSVTLPISCQLISGQNYRITFFCGGPIQPTENSGIMFQPSSLPYTESSSSFQIIQAYESINDVFPYNDNIFIPLIRLEVATTGINKINLAANSSVYPNPANQSATIQFENPEKENCTLTLYNIQGQIVQTIPNITTDKTEINRKDLSNGIYYFQLRGNNQLTSVGKIIFE